MHGSVSQRERQEWFGAAATRVRNNYSMADLYERAEAAKDWLFHRLLGHGRQSLDSDGIHYILCHGFLLDPWQICKEMIDENQVYLSVVGPPMIGLRREWRPRVVAGGFETGKRR